MLLAALSRLRLGVSVSFANPCNVEVFNCPNLYLISAGIPVDLPTEAPAAYCLPAWPVCLRVVSWRGIRPQQAHWPIPGDHWSHLFVWLRGCGCLRQTNFYYHDTEIGWGPAGPPGVLKPFDAAKLRGLSASDIGIPLKRERDDGVPCGSATFGGAVVYRCLCLYLDDWKYCICCSTSGLHELHCMPVPHLLLFCLSTV